jgi:hypothetical protein
MSQITTLTQELLLCMTGNLGKKDIISLSSTCKDLHSVLEPEIYRAISWTWHHSKKTVSRPVHTLLRNLLHKPKRASWVKKVSFQEIGFGQKPLLGKEQLSDKEIRSIQCLLESAQVPDTEEWISDVRDGSVDALLALILIQLPNLKSLTIDLFLRHDDDLAYATPDRSRIGQALQHAVSAPASASITRLASLEQLEWPSADFPGPMCFLRPIDMFYILPLFGLPALKRFSVKVDQRPSGSAPQCLKPDMTPLAKHLTTFRLRFSSVSFSALEGMLSSAPSLAVLDIECSRDMTSLEAGDSWAFDGKALRNALDRCRGTLESLRIVCSIDDPFLDIEMAEFFVSPLGSLSQLHSLSTVEMCLPLLLGTGDPTAQALQSALPASLEGVFIREDGYDIIETTRLRDVVSALAMEKSSNPPRLRCVGLCVNWENWGEANTRYVEDAYQDSGLELCMRDTAKASHS